MGCLLLRHENPSSVPRSLYMLGTAAYTPRNPVLERQVPGAGEPASLAEVELEVHLRTPSQVEWLMTEKDNEC